MRAKRKNKRTIRGSGTISVSVVVLIFLTVMSIQIYNMKQKDETYAAQEEAAREQLQMEEKRAKELSEREEYMQSDEFIEDTAKTA